MCMTLCVCVTSVKHQFIVSMHVPVHHDGCVCPYLRGSHNGSVASISNEAIHMHSQFSGGEERYGTSNAVTEITHDRLTSAFNLGLPNMLHEHSTQHNTTLGTQ